MEQINTNQSSRRENQAAHTASLATFDHAAAHREGWGLSDCGRRKDGTPRVELQKLDAPPAGVPSFAADKDAWAHVALRARAGSKLHIDALALVDPRERQAIRISTGIF